MTTHLLNKISEATVKADLAVDSMEGLCDVLSTLIDELVPEASAGRQLYAIKRAIEAELKVCREVNQGIFGSIRDAKASETRQEKAAARPAAKRPAVAATRELAEASA